MIAEWTVPRCVDQCPTEALQFGEEEDFADFIKDAELLNPGSRYQVKGIL